MLAQRFLPFTSATQSNAPASEQSPQQSAHLKTAENARRKTSSPPGVTKTDVSSDPVVIPARQRKHAAQNNGEKRRRNASRNAPETPCCKPRERELHAKQRLTPAVAALLASTTIPSPKTRPSPPPSVTSAPLTADAVYEHTAELERDDCSSLGKSPLDLLLSPPDDSTDSESTESSEISSHSCRLGRTLSTDSVPSLTDSSVDALMSPGFPPTPSPRGKRSYPTRKLKPLSPPGEDATCHPLSDPLAVDELDFRVFDGAEAKDDKTDAQPAPRQKSAFKSNLTASLRAIRSAAKSLSSIRAPTVPPDDFLTRSIIAIDPKVPFTDERMPPHIDETPAPAVRRYLNPTVNAPAETQATLVQKCPAESASTASIQMQTYKVSKLSKTQTTGRHSTTSEALADAIPVRQRDVRENSDFIRVAVMEMAMRRKGKLADNVPGRARWALPPRVPSTKPYEIGEGGVPVRWIAITVS